MSIKRTVIADEHVREAHRRGRAYIEILAGDIVTAQAKETADRLNIDLRDGPLERPTVVRTDGATAMRRILYRRHPGWVAPKRNVFSDAAKIRRFALVGAGGVGMNIAQLVANRDIAEAVTLVDVIPGVAEAIALDLTHSAGIHRKNTRFSGGTSMSLIAGADVVVVTAGRPRTPGMTRSDLLGINGRVIRNIGESIASLAPEAVVIVVSNPLDEMTYYLLQSTGFPRDRVLGMAGTSDSSRFRAILAQACGVAFADVEGMTLGSHGDEMVPLVSRAKVRGRALKTMLGEREIAHCIEQTVQGGAAVVALKKTGSATLAPAQATVEIIDHMRGDKAGAVPVSVYLKGEYGITDTVVGVPCVLGKRGLIEIKEFASPHSTPLLCVERYTSTAHRYLQVHADAHWAPSPSSLPQIQKAPRA